MIVTIAVGVVIATGVVAVTGIAVARGVTPEPFDGFEPSAFLPDAPASGAYRSIQRLVEFNRRSAKTHSGIWRDLAVRKRRTEVDAQLGIVVTLGKEIGVSTPLTAQLIELIHDVENGTRDQSHDTMALLSSK